MLYGTHTIQIDIESRYDWYMHIWNLSDTMLGEC